MPSLRTALSIAAVVSLAVTAAIALVPGLAFAYRNEDLHIALQTAEALIGLLASYLVLGRFHRRARLDALLLSVGLMVLAFSNLLFGAVAAVVATTSTPFATWSGLTGRTIGAILLAAAAFVPSHRMRLPAASRWPFAVAALVVSAIAVGVAAAGGALPAGVQASLPDAGDGPDFDVHPAILAAQVLSVGLYTAAVVGFARRAKQRRDELLGVLAVACVFGAAARVNYALYPSVFTEFVYVGDFFRLAFYVLVLVAALREIRSYWQRVADAAALDERRRLARDLHDGLAQELAGIQRNLAYVEDDDRFAQRARAAAERALGESRRAISALSGPEPGGVNLPLSELLGQIAEREGVELDLRLEDGVRLAPTEREALMMIAAEALTNAAKHGQADRVRVTLTGGRRVKLTVRDSGRGFDVRAVKPTSSSGFGLRSMRERAEAVGGRLRLSSAVGEGTQVEVVL